MEFKDVIELIVWIAAFIHVCAAGWYDITDNDQKTIKHASLACLFILILQGAL